MKTINILLGFILLLITGCQNDEAEISYSVTATNNFYITRISFNDSQGGNLILPNENLPWNYSFTAAKGYLLKVSANVFSDGTIEIVGTDTLTVIIYVDGVKFKEEKGLIINGSSDVVTVEGRVSG